jgi:DNA-binding transcriptional LysR family regulator
MNASDLKVFEQVARAGGMSRAADRLHTVQSNVTMRIRALERELGVSLFTRTPQGVVLTSAGERLLPFAAKVGQLLDDAMRAARDDGVPEGRLVVGSLETTAALRLAPLLSAFVERYPSVDLTLRTGTSCELIDDVLEHRVEGAFVCGPVDHADLVQRTVYSEQLAILTNRRFASLDDYLARNDPRIVVLKAGCSYRLMLEGWLARRGVVGARLLEFGTLEAIIACVEAGLGMTLLPQALVGGIWRQGRVFAHPLPHSEGAVDTLFVRRRDAYQSSALKAFLALAIRHYRAAAVATEEQAPVDGNRLAVTLGRG